jgi:hypothetical protein
MLAKRDAEPEPTASDVGRLGYQIFDVLCDLHAATHKVSKARAIAAVLKTDRGQQAYALARGASVADVMKGHSNKDHQRSLAALETGTSLIRAFVLDALCRLPMTTG